MKYTVRPIIENTNAKNHLFHQILLYYRQQQMYISGYFPAGRISHQTKAQQLHLKDKNSLNY